MGDMARCRTHRCRAFPTRDYQETPTMRNCFRLVLIFIILGITGSATLIFAFSFSEYENQEKASEINTRPLPEVRCPASLRTSRIVTMIGESRRDGGSASAGLVVLLGSPANIQREDSNGSYLDILNTAFTKLGLKTLTAGELNEQIARAEQEAVLNNDMDAAISAASKLQADYLVKGVISTSTQTNKVIQVEEVFVSIALSLYDSQARLLANTAVQTTSFSDADVHATMQNLLKTEADQIIHRLFMNICKGSSK